jgi:hypothetical protein
MLSSVLSGFGTQYSGLWSKYCLVLLGYKHSLANVKAIMLLFLIKERFCS